MEMRLYRSIECRLRKLNYFFFAPHSLTHSLNNQRQNECMLDFTHHCVAFLSWCSCSIRCVFLHEHEFICLVYDLVVLACAACKTATSNRKSVKKKYRWNLWDWKLQNCNQLLCNDITIAHASRAAMTLQPVNSAILTLRVACCR